MNNDTFYILINDQGNSRSGRFDDYGVALKEAQRRVENGAANKVYLLRAVEVVRRQLSPVIVESLEAPAQIPEGGWHNPADLDADTIGIHAGWRLLTKAEHREQLAAFSKETAPLDGKCEGWTGTRWNKGNNCGHYDHMTYRTLEPLP